MTEVEEIVTRQYKCPICGHLYKRRKLAELCAKASYEPLAQPGDEVKLKNRNYGYTQATVVSVKPRPPMSLTVYEEFIGYFGEGDELSDNIKKEESRSHSHQTTATLDDYVCLDHKWEDHHNSVSLSTYLLTPDDPEYQERMEHGRDDNNSW